jgi:hypothetical protein
MSYKEVTQLRKSGEIGKAYEMAKADLEASPEDIWAKRALAWCDYEFLKENANSSKRELFLESLKDIQNMGLPSDEVYIFDSIPWKVLSLLSDCHKKESYSEEYLNSIFETIKQMSFTKPSESYSILFKAFLSMRGIWLGFKTFCEWWGFENFQGQDYNSEKLNNGEKIMSLAERGYIAYSKELLRTSSEGKLETDKILAFIPLIENLSSKHPEYQYPPYFIAKLHLALDDKAGATNALKPFALKKQSEFWVWQLLGEAAEDTEMCFSLYCKAMLLPAKVEMTVKLRETMAFMLQKRGFYNEARCEVDKAISTRKENNWGIDKLLTEMASREWYLKATQASDIKEFYRRNSVLAESFLFAEIKQTPILITYVNKDKGMASFVDAERKGGWFNYLKTKCFKNAYPKENNIYLIRSNNMSSISITTIIDAEPTKENKYTEPFIRNYSGSVHITANKFGFANDVFIPATLLIGVSDRQEVSGEAVISYDKRQSRWGWKAISINQL